MRLKSYTARTLKDAMDKVREEMGEEAIIVNVSDDGAGVVRVMAAAERRASQPEPLPELAPPAPAPVMAQPYDGETLSAMLRYHGIPSQLATRIQTAASAMDGGDLAQGLACGLETIIGFAALGARHERPLLLIGPPGAGKTLTAAKLAADAIIAGQIPRLLTMDTVRAGGLAQLDHYAQLMRLSVGTASTPEELRSVLGQAAPAALTLIDTVGVNPYSIDDVQLLARVVKLTGAEPVVVLPAGVDALEAAEMADIFSSLGARRMVATRLDAARRYAGLITAMYKGRLALAALATGPYVADSLLPPTPLALARLIIAKPDPARLRGLKKKAMP
ncbi:MAG: GTPase [Pseudomonadota bacterium]